MESISKLMPRKRIDAPALSLQRKKEADEKSASFSFPSPIWNVPLTLVGRL
jgi:hypothetical protein